MKGYPFPILHSHHFNSYSKKIGYVKGNKAFVYAWDDYSDYFKVNCYAVGFCGKIYPLLKLYKSNPPKKMGKEVFVTFGDPTICFNIEDVIEFVKNNFSEKQFAGFHDKKFRNTKTWEWGMRKHNFEEHFAKMNEIKDKHGNLFLKHHAPILVADMEKHKVFYNASLREFEFFRMFDPFTAFQEIAMFMGNMAEPRKEMPKIDDATMAEIKGFNKYSFRKDKSKRK